MSKKIFLIFLAFLFFSCSITKNYEISEKNYCPIFPKITKIVVLPFDEKGKREEIQEGAAEKLRNMTEKKLKDLNCLLVVTWEEANLKINGSEKELYKNLTTVESIKKLGEIFRAEAVLKGYVVRYVDKVGGKYGVKSPASVSFYIEIYDTSNGSILWTGSYRETQVSLSENLLNADLFFKRGFKWLTADELARFGVSEIINRIPGVNK